jgi:hypothetical protein
MQARGFGARAGASRRISSAITASISSLSAFRWTCTMSAFSTSSIGWYASCLRAERGRTKREGAWRRSGA